MATKVAERFLEKYRDSSFTESMDVLDALGSTVFISKDLLFLSMYPTRQATGVCQVLVSNLIVKLCSYFIGNAVKSPIGLVKYSIQGNYMNLKLI